MEPKMKSAFVHTMMRVRKATVFLPPGCDIRTGELFVLNKVAGKSASMSEIQDKLFMTKPAVSQILNGLENKGLVHREIDPRDRRRIMVTLTPRGDAVLRNMKGHTDHVMDTTLSRFGEENTQELIRLLNLLADITEELKEDMKREAEKPPALDNLKGETPID